MNRRPKRQLSGNKTNKTRRCVGMSDDSDEQVFISTQIQGKIEDFELREAERKKFIGLFKRFRIEKKGDAQCQNESGIEIAGVKKCPAKKDHKGEKKRSRTRKKKLSVTDQMIRKLSGKPQKLKKQMHQPEWRTSSRVSSFGEEPDEYNGCVYTESEWKKIRFTIHGSQHPGSSVPMSRSSESQQQRLWDSASKSPDLAGDEEDWEYLQSHHRNQKVELQCERRDEASLTLSQLFQEKDQNPVLVDSGQESEGDISFGSEVPCSSVEGSMISLVRKPSTDLVNLCSSQEARMHAVSSQVKYKGSTIKLRDSYKCHICVAERSPHHDDWIANSSDDEEDVSQLLEITRKT